VTRREFAALAPAALLAAGKNEPLLAPDQFRRYVEEFNRTYREEVVNHIPDARAWEWMKENVPLFACPDREIEQLYYYRWWAFRKHIKETPAGFLVTEFLKPVSHAGEYNALSCAFGLHVAEGRWLRDVRYIDGDIHFWLKTGKNGGIRENFHQFSGWAAAALYERWLADGRGDVVVSYLGALQADYAAWERERLTASGLFWQRDVSDGMESSISGGRRVKNIRPSINSYMYGNADAIARIADLAGERVVAGEYRVKAGYLKGLGQRLLWNPEAAFFETRRESGEFAEVRENIGFTPWMFGLPDRDAGCEAAWKQLMDPQGFYAPYGPTTAERRHAEFQIPYSGDDCQWNGPSWPFATTVTLKALANVLNGYEQNAVTRADWFRTFQIYSRSQHLKLEDGRTVPFVDENLNPLTGEWLARALKMRKKGFYARGDHYNHSGYADLVITGLAGLRPAAGAKVTVAPLAPSGTWDWFCVDRIPYHGKMLSIVWDRAGIRFGRGKGLAVFADGREIARGRDLRPVSGTI
jgi:hypothetical protein